MKTSARKIWLNFHFGLALIAGAFFACLGLSGALLVFKGPLLEWELGCAMVRPEVRGTVHASVDAWIAGARAEVPELSPVIGVNAPRSGFLPTSAAVVFGRLGPGGGLGVAMVDPYTAEALGHFDYDRSWFATVVEFHRRLLLPIAIGTDVVAWCGLAMMLSLASGLYLWWPRHGYWLNVLTLRRRSRGLRLLRELHNVAAAYLMMPLLVLAVTGVLLLKPGWLRILDQPAVGPSRMSTPSAAPTCATGLGAQEAVDAALQTKPASTLIGLSMPRGETPGGTTYIVRLRTGDHDAPVQLLVTGGCFGPVVVEQPVPDAVRRDLLSRLHAQLLLGMAGQGIVLMAGLSLPALYVTGIAMWWKRRRTSR